MTSLQRAIQLLFSVFFNKLKIPSIMGGENFILWVKEKFYTQKRDDNAPESKRLAPSPEQVIMAVCQQYNTEPSLVYQGRRGINNESRNVAIYLTRHLCGLPLSKIGTKFNIQKTSSVSSVVARLTALLNA